MTVLAGFFPTSVVFRGSFRYADAAELERALDAIRELLDGEDDDIASDLELRRKHCELRVRVDTTCARDEYLAYETLVETLATFAIDGEVTGEIDDTITTYGVPSTPAIAKAAGMLAWLPLLATDLDLWVLA